MAQMTEYEITEKDQKMIDNDFTFHPAQGDQGKRYEKLRGEAKKLCELIFKLCPESRERSLAKTQLEIAVMYANAAIARNEEAPAEE